MRAVIYCRVSSAEQVQNLSLPTQEKSCREYCERNGYDVDQVFVDAGESAKTTDRPAFQRLLAHCRHQKGKLHAVVVYSLTRFSRNTTDHHVIAGLLRGLGIALRSVTEPIDDTPSGRLMESILAAFGQFDNDVRSQRVRAGIRAAVDRGRWCWQAPIGYLNTDVHRGASLAIDETRAAAVRAAFEAYDNGVEGRALLRHVRGLGLTSSNKTTQPISRAQLGDLLRARVYAGSMQPRGWTEPVKGDWPALVSVELWERVQLRLDGKLGGRRKFRTHRDHPDFPLRRFVRCSCGAAITGSWSKGRTGVRYPFYACPKGCCRFRKAQLEAEFLQLLDALKPRQDVWPAFRDIFLEEWRAERQEAVTVADAARRQVVTLEGQLRRLEQRYLAAPELVDVELYRLERAALRERIAIAKIDAAERSLEEIDLEGVLEFAEHALEHAQSLWTSATTAEERLKIQWTFFPDGLHLLPPRESVVPSFEVTKTGGTEWASGKFRMPATYLQVFQLSRRTPGEEVVMVPGHPSWKQTVTWLTAVSQLLSAA